MKGPGCSQLRPLVMIVLPVCLQLATFLVKPDIRHAAPRIPAVSRFPLSRVVEQLVKSPPNWSLVR